MTTKTGERRLVNAWIDPEDAERLDDDARAADRSRSAELRIAVREHLERADDEKEAGT
jgi:predicted transcriptional regulator